MCKILLVEDDAELRSLMARVLERDGHGVAEAGNGLEALELLRAGERPALVLLDLMMPVMSGPELLEVMSADPALATVPVVVVSALSGGDVPGVRDFLQKPVTTASLRAAVEQHADAA
jgi:CheY-like chemotaxis protein